MASNSGKSSAPSWAIPVGVALLVVIVAFFAWRSFGRNSAVSNAPPMAVHPGMYDFKKEAASGNLGRPPTERQNFH